MGRPIVCNTCCPSDDPPPPSDCFGAIGVVFIDESNNTSRSKMRERIEKYLRAFPDRLIFIMDVEEGSYGTMNYNEYPQFVSSDRCYSLRLEHDAGLSLPRFIKRDGSGVVSDVYDYIVEIVTNSSKSTDEVREIWNTATEVSVFRDDSGSMKASQVQKTYDKFNTDLVANNKFIVSSEINTNEDFICPFVFEQCCINQDAADLLKTCLSVDCTPAELRFLTHPNSVYAIDDPCDSLLIDNAVGTCDFCPPVRSFDHQVKYKAAVRESSGAILSHFDIDYYLQYRDSPDDNFVDLFDLPDAKSNIEQLFDVLLRNFMCGDAPAAAGGAVNNWQLVSIKEGEDILGPLTPQGFGFCIDISGDGEYIVVGPSRVPVSDGKQGKIVTFKRTVSGQGVVDYDLLNSFDIEDMEVVNRQTELQAENDITITPNGKTMAFSCNSLGPAHPDSFVGADGTNEKNVGKAFVYDLDDSENWVQRGSAITWDDIGSGGAGGSVEISSDGNTVLVCPDSDVKFGRIERDADTSARVFSWNGVNWVQKGQDLVLPDLPAEQLLNEVQRWVFDSAMSDDGLVIALSETVYNQRGLVRVYEYNAATSQWDIRHDFVGEHGQFIGSAVGMSKDGTRIAFSGHEGNSAVGSDPTDIDSDKGDYIFNAYDWDGSSYNAVGNTVKYPRDNTNIQTRGQAPQIDFADSKDLVSFCVQLDGNPNHKVVVLKLVADTWVQQGGDFSQGDDNTVLFGSGASISRTGFTGAGKDFGHTLVFGDPRSNNKEGKIYIYLSSQFGGGNPDPPDDDCEKVSCHPLISDMGNPPSSCDVYEDTGISGNCTRRVFKREFRIRASNESLTSVFSDPFKLYRYISKKSVDEPNGGWELIADDVGLNRVRIDDGLTLSFDADGEKITISDSVTPSVQKGTVFTLIAEDQFNWKEHFTIFQGSDNFQKVGLAQFSSDRQLQNEWTPTDSDDVLWKNSPSMVFVKEFNDSVRWMVPKDLTNLPPGHHPSQFQPHQSCFINEIGAPQDAVAWGDSIAIDGDGDTIVVGDREANGGRGKIYVYRWIYDDKAARRVELIFYWSDGTPGSQKRQVKIDKSGQVVAWVEPYDDTRANNCGRVVVLSHTGPSKLLLGDRILTREWRQRPIIGMELKENNGPDLKMDLSADGNTIIISSVKGVVNTHMPTERTGFAKVFQWDGSSYRKKGSTLKGVSTIDEFGTNCAISSDGNVIAISSREEDPTNQSGIGANHGAVRCFFWNGTDWEQLGQTIRGDNGSAQLGFKLDLIVNPEGLKRLALSSNVSPTHTKVKLYQFIPR